MSMSVQYHVELDLNRNGRFDHANADVSSRVQSVSMNHGMVSSYDSISQFARCMVSLNNEDGAVSPDDATATYYGLLERGLLCRLRAKSSTNVADENMMTSPSGTDNDGGSYDATNDVYTLVDGAVNNDGGITYSMTDASTVHIRATVRIESGVDACIVYWGASQYVDIASETSGQRAIVLTPSGGSYAFNGSDVTTFDLPHELFTGASVDVDVYCTDNALLVKIDGRQVLDYDDSTRTLGGLVCGVTAYRSTPSGTDDAATLTELVIVEGGIDVVLFVGKLREVNQTLIDNQKRLDIVFSGPMEQFLDTYFEPEVEANVRTDVAIERVLELAYSPYPYEGTFFIIDADEIDSDYPLYDYNVDKRNVLEEGLYTIDWIGDIRNNPRGVNVRGYIDDILTAEGDSRFYYDARSARFHFTNRVYDAFNNTPSINLEGHIVDAFVMREDNVVNNGEIVYYPRQAQDDTTIYESDRPIRLAPNSTKTFTARYGLADNPDTKVQARIVFRVTKDDYNANSEEDGSGDSKQDPVSFRVTNEFNSASVEITNIDSEVVYLTYLRLRGDALFTEPNQTFYFVDADSMKAYDRQPMSFALTARYISDKDEAEGRLSYYISQRSEPVTRYESVRISKAIDDSSLDGLLLTGIGQCVRVVNSAVDHDETYIVVGERHTVRINAGMHEIEYILKPTSRTKVFVIDQSFIDSNDLIL